MAQGWRNLWQLARTHSSRLTRAHLGMALGVIVVGGTAFALGRTVGLGATSAQPPSTGVKAPQSIPGDLVPAGYDPEYQARVVAYIYGNIPIYRYELAEYLIARFGAPRLEFLVNRKIIERVCQAKSIYVTDEEVEAQFRQDLLSFGPHMNAQLFQDQVLKRYNKTLFEWKEDVIRPKLALTKLVSSEVIVTDSDIMKRFEILYGPKVKCRMIVFNDTPSALKAWEQIRSSRSVEEAFLQAAKQQAIPELAALGGEVPPIHKHFGDPRIEKEAFRLKPGEMSQAFGMPDNKSIILLCERHIPADTTKVFEKERTVLLPEVRNTMIAEKVQERVVQLRREAAPRMLLGRQPSMEQVQRDALEQIGDLPFRPIEGK